MGSFDHAPRRGLPSTSKWSRARRFAVIPALALLGAGLALVGPAALPTQAVVDGCSTYTTAGIITGTSGFSSSCTRALDIPADIGGAPVTEIAANAFKDKGIVSVNIPNNLGKCASPVGGTGIAHLVRAQ